MRRRTIGLSTASLVLGLLGVSTLAAFPVGLSRTSLEEIPWLSAIVALMYGATALAASVAIWRLSPSASAWLLVWFTVLLVFTVHLAYELPDIRVALGLGLATVSALVWAAIRSLRVACTPAA